MSFLFALSQADQVQKKAKRDALVAALQEQVLEKQAKKDAAIAQQKRKEEEELRKLEAKGLDMWGRPIRVKEDEPAPGNRSQRGVGESSARHLVSASRWVAQHLANLGDLVHLASTLP